MYWSVVHTLSIANIAVSYPDVHEMSSRFTLQTGIVNLIVLLTCTM